MKTVGTSPSWLGRSWLLRITFILPPLLLASYILRREGRLCVVLACMSCIGIAVLLNAGMRQVAPGLAITRVINAAYGIQLLWIAVTVTAGLSSDPTAGVLVDIAEQPLRAIFPLLIVPVGSAIGLLLAVLVTAHHARRSIWGTSVVPPSGLDSFLVVGAVLNVLFIPALTDAFGPVSYFIRALHLALQFLPLLAGRYSRRWPIVHRTWITSLTIVLFMGLTLGHRYDSLMGPALYACGYLLGSSRHDRKRACLACLALAMSLLFLSGLAGIVREGVGRGGVELLTRDRVDQVLAAAAEALEGGNPRVGTPTQDARFTSLGRMVVWSNMAVTTLSPETIPYRGWDDIGGQLADAAHIFYLNGESRQELLDKGLFQAASGRYGYGTTSSSSFEFGVVADGWSRNGVWGAFAFGAVSGFCFTLLEVLSSACGRFSSSLPVVLFVVFVSLAASTVTATLVTTLRQAVLYFVLVGTAGVIVETLRGGLGKREARPRLKKAFCVSSEPRSSTLTADTYRLRL